MGIYAAIARKASDDDRPAWFADQSITLKQGVRAYTIGSADICGWHGKAGVLSPGAWADLVVLSDDIFKVKLEQVPRLKVLATVFNGKVVYTDRNFKL